MLRRVVLPGRGSEPLGRIWSSWDQNAEPRPLVISKVVKLRRGPRQRSKVGRGGSSRQLEEVQL